MASERAISRLRREIDRIEQKLLPTEGDDDEETLLLLRYKRDNLVRGLILEIHIRIDDLLSVGLRNAILEGRSVRTKMREEVDALLEGNRAMRFHHKLLLVRTLGWLTPTQFQELEQLNNVRNKCGHGWELHKVVRRGRKRAGPKRRVLTYKGKNVYEPEVLVDFIRHFNRLYFKLYLKLGKYV
jgi:hypothetical protein